MHTIFEWVSQIFDHCGATLPIISYHHWWSTHLLYYTYISHDYNFRDKFKCNKGHWKNFVQQLPKQDLRPCMYCVLYSPSLNHLLSKRLYLLLILTLLWLLSQLRVKNSFANSISSSNSNLRNAAHGISRNCFLRLFVSVPPTFLLTYWKLTDKVS